MADEDKQSPIAKEVVEGLLRPDVPNGPQPHRGAIMLRGYLANNEGEYNRRLFVEDTFRVWFEFNAADILHHIPGGGTDPCCTMGVVWLKRESVVRKVTVGYAYVVADVGGDEGDLHRKPWGMADDPGGVWRKPYP